MQITCGERATYCQRGWSMLTQKDYKKRYDKVYLTPTGPYARNVS